MIIFQVHLCDILFEIIIFIWEFERKANYFNFIHQNLTICFIAKNSSYWL